MLLMLILFASDALHADEPSPFSQLQDMTLCIPMLQEARSTALCAVHAEGFHWFIANGDATWGGTFLPGDPITSHTLAEIALSPSEKYLAISEASEGHPAASVIDFELWRTQGIIKSLWRSAVYPGYIAISHWQGESLVLTSNHDLTREDQLHLSTESDQLLADREFLLDPGSGHIVQMGSGRPNLQ